MMRTFQIPLLAAVMLFGFSRPAAPQPQRIPTVTRLVQRFSELESSLMDATAAGDATRAAGFLAQDFEMRIGSAPGNPIPRAEWLVRITAHPTTCDIGSMAVHDLVNAAAVSFRCGGSAVASFVVDIWVPDHDSWKLQVRFASPAAGPVNGLPGGAAPGSATIKKKQDTRLTGR